MTQIHRLKTLTKQHFHIPNIDFGQNTAMAFDKFVSISTVQTMHIWVNRRDVDSSCFNYPNSNKTVCVCVCVSHGEAEPMLWPSLKLQLCHFRRCLFLRFVLLSLTSTLFLLSYNFIYRLGAFSFDVVCWVHYYYRTRCWSMMRHWSTLFTLLSITFVVILASFRLLFTT